MKQLKFRFHLLISMILVYLPVTVSAHGTEEEHQQETLFYNTLIDWFFILSVLLLIIGVIGVWIYSKKKKAHKDQQQVRKFKKASVVFTWISIVALVSTFSLGFIKINQNEAVGEKTSGLELTHIHGLGYTSDGKGFYIPAHDGLRAYIDGQWSVPEGEQHDYMGFSMVDDGFYSSGHPGPGSKLENPFGIVKSTDLGKSLELLDLYKEIDFHGMAVGYYSHAIYVLNPEPNSRMQDTGLYYTLDDTKTWTKSEMKGLEGQAASIAVHQEDDSIIAIGTNQGAFISTDNGNTFENLLPNVPTSALHFTKEGKLLVGGVEDGSVLYQMDVTSKEKQKMDIPEINQDDALSYIAMNPQNRSEMVITTMNRDVYLTTDNGIKWTQIAKQGSTVDTQATESH